MAKSKRRKAQQAKRTKSKSSRESGMKNPSGESGYGRKRKYLVKNGGFGFDYPPPKPWKS